jgi:uncharacterized protein with HEPN domain
MFPAMTESARHVPWPRVKAIGDHLRHAYQRVDAEILWNIYAQGELATLREAVTAFIASLEANDQPSAKE